MDDNCGEWMECMGVASGCGEQEVGVATGCGCKEYIDFLILLIPTHLVSTFLQQHPYFFCSFF